MAAREAFLKGKGFTDEEIADAKKQAEEILRKRAADSASSSSSGTFGVAIKRKIAEGTNMKTSTEVTIGGLSFYSHTGDFSRGDGDDVIKQLSAVLDRLGTNLGSKSTLAVLLVAIADAKKHRGTVHQMLDDWIDPSHPPTRTILDLGSEESGGTVLVEVLAVARA